MPPTRPTAIAAVFLLALLGYVLWPAFTAAGHCMDEGMLLVYPELLLKGKLPYRDFETFYGPLNICVLAGAYSLAGVSVFVERSVGLLYHLAILSGLFMLVRRGGLIAAIAATVLAELFLRLANVHALAWNGGLACAIWAVVALGSENRWRAFLGGLLGAAALLYRPDLGPAVLLSAAPLVWPLSARHRWKYGIGFAVGLIPLAGFAWLAGFGNTYDNLFRYPVLVGNAGRRIPFGQAADWAQDLIWLHLGACACNLGAGVVGLRKQLPTAPVLFATALLALGLTPQAIQRIDVVHLATTIFASIAILPWSLITLIRQTKTEANGRAYSLASALLVLGAVCFVSFPVVQTYARNASDALNASSLDGVVVQSGERQFPVESVVRARHFRRALSFLRQNAAPGQRLFVGGKDLRYAYANDTVFYHLAPWLEPASYFLEMNPLSANREGSRLADDIASADWLVLDAFWDLSNEPNESRRLGSNRPNEIVASRFELIGRVGWLTVYRKRGSLASAVAVTTR